VARLADHIVVLDHGRAVAQGPLTETLARVDLPLHRGEDAGVVLECVVAERDSQWSLTRVDFGGGCLWLRDAGIPIGARVRVRILARDVSIALHKFDSSIANTLPATLVAQGGDDHPALVLLRLQVGDEIVLARLTRRSADQLRLVDGMNVWVQIKAVALL
jgi:molybdate transport system ATP-binding protein